MTDRGITKEEADFLLKNDIDIAKDNVSNKIKNFNDLDEVRQAVLVDMCLNLGWPHFSKFKKFLAIINKADDKSKKESEEAHYERASKEMLDSLWAKQVGKRAECLSLMMKTGKWPKS